METMDDGAESCKVKSDMAYEMLQSYQNLSIVQ